MSTTGLDLAREDAPHPPGAAEFGPPRDRRVAGSPPDPA